MKNFFDDTNSDNVSAYEHLFNPCSFENEDNDFSSFKEDASINNLNDTNIIHKTAVKEPINIINLNLEGTNDATNQKLNLNYPLKASPKIGSFTHFCSLNSIRGILVSKIGDDDDIITSIINNECVTKEEKYLNTTEKMSVKNENDYISDKGKINGLGEKTENNLSKKKRSRVPKNDGGKEHNCYSADNVIKKIKAKLFDECHKFLNIMIDDKDKKEIILKIGYKNNIDKLKKDYNLELLERPLKYLFSLDVSDKYRSKKENKDYNANVIKEIIEDKKHIEIEDYNTINFLLNISLNDWIDLFTYKKDIYNLKEEYGATEINYEKIENIQKECIGAIHLLKDISKEDKTYYTLFILYLFNFQRWFWIRKGRNEEKKEIESKKEKVFI
jgi:hypothetical protein